MKIVYDNLSYRVGKPSATELGFRQLNFCNRGFYGSTDGGVTFSTNLAPVPALVDRTVQALPNTESIYFDLEPWLCLPDNESEFDKIRKKMYSVELLAKFRDLNPTFSKHVGIFGIPDGNVHPQNALADIEKWKAKNRRLMSGEVWQLLYSRINCLMPCFYPYDYGNGDATKTNEIQFSYNQMQLDILREFNVNKYPIYAFWQPRLKKPDGSRPFMTYQDTLTQMNWILSRCDGVVLWDWDGQIDPATGQIAVWNNNFPWLKAVRDSVNSFNNQTIINQTISVNSTTPFIRNGKIL